MGIILAIIYTWMAMLFAGNLGHNLSFTTFLPLGVVLMLLTPDTDS